MKSTFPICGRGTRGTENQMLSLHTIVTISGRPNHHNGPIVYGDASHLVFNLWGAVVSNHELTIGARNALPSFILTYITSNVITGTRTLVKIRLVLYRVIVFLNVNIMVILFFFEEKVG